MAEYYNRCCAVNAYSSVWFPAISWLPRIISSIMNVNLVELFAQQHHSSCCNHTVSFISKPKEWSPSTLGISHPASLVSWRLCFTLTDHGAIDVSCSTESFRGMVFNWGSRSLFRALKHFSAIGLQPHQHFWTAVWRLTCCLRKKLLHFLLR